MKLQINETIGINLKTFFDRVYIISLDRRADRRERLQCEMDVNGWPFAKPIWFRAIDGNKVPHPDDFTQKGGAWGCLESHRTILRECLMDGVQSVLVLEDDAVLRNGWVDRARTFITAAPGDWEQLMFGGQLTGDSTQKTVNGEVRAVTQCERTHCYALRGDAIGDLYKAWHTSVKVHCDWIMGDWQERGKKVYAPHEFIVGQSAGRSDICAIDKSASFWNEPSGKEPVFVLRCSREIMTRLRAHGFHVGRVLDPVTGYAEQIGKMMSVRELEKSMIVALLANWIKNSQWEVQSVGDSVMTIWHDQIEKQWVKDAYDGPVYEIIATSVDDALSQARKLTDNVRFESRHENFSHAGDVGDLIYSLPTMRAMGGGIINLCPAEWTRLRMNQKTVDSLRPLLTAQSYIDKVFFTDSPQGVPLDTWRRSMDVRKGSLVKWHLDSYGLPESESYPWLKAEPDEAAKVIVHRSPRYHNERFPWASIVDKYKNKIAMVGSLDEHREFCERFGAVNYLQTNSMLSLAQVIAGSKLFVGNQSAPMAIALGLGGRVIQESCFETPNCILPRDGSQFILDNPLSLPDI
jgi:hypothetical protein